MTKITMKKIEVRGNVFIGFCLTIAEQVRCRSSLGGRYLADFEGKNVFFVFFICFLCGKEENAYICNSFALLQRFFY